MFINRIKPTNLNKLQLRSLTTSKAIIYSKYGEPINEIEIHSYNIPDPIDNEIVTQTVAHPINPSDINQIEGVYPSRPKFSTKYTDFPSAIAGNEGLSKVISIGKNVKSLQVGDYIIPSFPNFGTWRSHSIGKETDFIKINKPNVGNLTNNAMACLSVNTCTAYELLTTINPLSKGDWVVQNGGNSSVGKFVIQIAKILGYNTLNVVRDRPSIEELKDQLYNLGATKVITEEENSSKEFGKTVKQWVGDGQVKLALNCVGGKSSSNIARKLSPDGFMASYGAMSKQPIMLPTSLFIFKNITAKGYWITKNNFKDFEQKKKVVGIVSEYFNQKKLVPSPATENFLDWERTNEEILEFYKSALINSKKGKQLIVSKE